MSDGEMQKGQERGPIIFVAEVIGAITAFGFLASALVQSWVFGLWGISYFQVATAGDVVMGGLSYLFSATPIWVLFFTGMITRRALILFNENTPNIINSKKNMSTRGSRLALRLL